MKKCYECGAEIAEDANVCPKCGAPQIPPRPVESYGLYKPNQPRSIKLESVSNYTALISSVLFAAGALIFLITTFVEWVFIFAGIVLFLAAAVNLVSSILKFIKQINK